MELGQLYQFILLLVMLGMLIGAALVVMVNFSSAPGVAVTAANSSDVARQAIQNTTAAIASIPNTWLGIIVIIAIMAVIIVLIVRAFGGAGMAPSNR